MEIEAAVARHDQERFRQDLSVGDHDADIGSEGGKPFRFLGGLQARWRQHLDAEAGGDFVHRRAALGEATAGGTRRLGVNRHDLMTVADDLGEGRDSERGRAEEDDAKGHGGAE